MSRTQGRGRARVGAMSKEAAWCTIGLRKVKTCLGGGGVTGPYLVGGGRGVEAQRGRVVVGL